MSEEIKSRYILATFVTLYLFNVAGVEGWGGLVQGGWVQIGHSNIDLAKGGSGGVIRSLAQWVYSTVSRDFLPFIYVSGIEPWWAPL